MDKNGQDFDSTGESNRLIVGGGKERERERETIKVPAPFTLAGYLRQFDL